eukprot:12900994-Prorocentrum_lima.AAC.1
MALRLGLGILQHLHHLCRNCGASGAIVASSTLPVAAMRSRLLCEYAASMAGRLLAKQRVISPKR